MVLVAELCNSVPDPRVSSKLVDSFLRICFFAGRVGTVMGGVGLDHMGF